MEKRKKGRLNEERKGGRTEGRQGGKKGKERSVS